MKSTEQNVLPNSDFYTYNASEVSKSMFFYPVYLGEFYYSNDYQLYRNNFDNFLFMYLTSGSCEITVDNKTYIAEEHDVVLIDCYKPHAYKSKEPWSNLWIHFDGPLAREQYDALCKDDGPIIKPRDPNTVEYTLRKIINVFRDKANVWDSSMNKYITFLLTELFLSEKKSQKKTRVTENIENVITYINEHYMEQITVEQLADLANFSQYYFIKIFSEETGLTPLQYVINTRITAAKYLLKTTHMSVKEIGFSSGFTSESVFCSTFKKRENLTPSQYRMIDVTHD